jgi:hypothetical protein
LKTCATYPTHVRVSAGEDLEKAVRDRGLARAADADQRAESESVFSPPLAEVIEFWAILPVACGQEPVGYFIALGRWFRHLVSPSGIECARAGTI